MTYKQIEASREARLWLGQIIVPALTFAATTLAIPEVRQAIAGALSERLFLTSWEASPANRLTVSALRFGSPAAAARRRASG